MVAIATTTCNRCGRRYQQSLENGNVFKFPDGWRRYDFNTLGPEDTNIFDLCPFCQKEFADNEEQRLRDFVAKPAPRGNKEER